MNKLFAGECLSLLLGVTMMDIESVLSLVLVVISIVLALINVFLKLRIMLKDGKLDKQEMEELQQDINNIKETINDK